MNPNQIISLRILKAMDEGKSLKEAVDSVLGEGTYDKMADIYEDLRAKP